ncbi:LPS assembly protein LptD [Desulfovibrio sp. OttesenSCG-928-O18]|nr:LPS assembly protein LptD [Desulfovibrio sp. OttesenSCG-928-O18]
MIRAAYRLPPLFAGFFILFLLFFMAVPRAFGASPNSLTMQAEDERAVTWTLNADKVTSLSASEVIEAEGNVVLQRGGEYLKADYARYYSSTKWVFLRGNVQARMGKDEMKADEAEFDLRSRVGWLKNGQIYMDGPHMYFAGQRIDKHWGDVYSFKQAKVTACDGDVPAWSLEAEEAVVEIDGYAQLWRPKFQIKDMPVLFSPWMIIPAKKERQTGFLAPEVGQSNKRGFYYNQPFFWAIDESRDMTFNEYFMGKRGFMQGVEYRSRPSVRETTWLRFDWLHDKVEVNRDSDDDVNDSDGLVRNNRDRFWLRGMYEGHLGDPKWKLRADLDFVSDQNMLHEFKSGYSGYNRSRTELFDLFRRDLQEKDLNRQSGFMLFRDWDRVTVALSSRYYQDQTLGHGNRNKSTDTTVQSLPQLDLFLHKGSIVDGLPLEVSAGMEAGYKYRREGTRGMRYVMTPSLSLPINGRYGSLITTAGLQQTFYGTDTYAKTGGEAKQDGKSQTIPTFQMDGSTEVMRTFKLGNAPTPTKENVGTSKWTALRHSIQPRVRYRNIPLKDQHDNPRYDSGDRILPVNELTYSVSNILTRKRAKVVAAKPAKEGEEATPVVTQDYLEFLRFSLEQSYDMRESTRTDDRGEYERRPFGDLIAEAKISFDEYLAFTSRSYYSPYLDTFTRHDHGVTFTYMPWGHLYTGVGYRRELDEYKRYRSQTIKTIDVKGELNLYGPFSLAFAYTHDWERSENVDRELRLIYNHQCFQIMGVFSKDSYEEHYGVRVAITGLGS